MLTVQTYDGEVDTRILNLSMASHTVCIQEAEAKTEELELQLGKDHILNYNYEEPFKMMLGGKLLGVSVGCESRN